MITNQNFKSAQTQQDIYFIKLFFISFTLSYLTSCSIFLSSIFVKVSVKSIFANMGFAIYIKPLLVILPTFLSTSIPFAFALSLFVCLYFLYKGGWYTFHILYANSYATLINLGALFSLLFSLIIYFADQNILEDLDSFIKDEINSSVHGSGIDFIIPNTLNVIGEYYIFPTSEISITDNGRYLKGKIYKVYNGMITLTAKGTLFEDKSGGLYLNDLRGIEFKGDSYFSFYTEINKQSIRICKNEINDIRSINEFVYHYKMLIRSPSFHFSNIGHKYSYPWQDTLDIIFSLQKYIFIFSPTMLYGLILLIFRLLVIYPYKTRIPFLFDILTYCLIFIWFIMSLILPTHIKISYYSKPSFAVFYYLFVSLLIIIAIPMFRVIIYRFYGNK